MMKGIAWRKEKELSLGEPFSAMALFVVTLMVKPDW